MNIGFAMCGSFCTFEKVFPVMEQLAGEHEVIPIFSEIVHKTDSRFGTAAGAWASLVAGMLINMSGIVFQRTWATHIYPFLESNGWVDVVGGFLSTVSKPLNPYVVWEMNRMKFPINSYEVYFIAMFTSLVLYIVVSLLTYKEPFNLDRMLHRGKYAIEGEKKIHMEWSFKNVFSKLIGITPEYSKSDRIIARSVFTYSFIYQCIYIPFDMMIVLFSILTLAKTGVLDKLIKIISKHRQ